MRMRFLIVLVLLLFILQLQAQSSSSKPLTESEAKQFAADFANREVKDKLYEHLDGSKKHYPQVSAEYLGYAVLQDGRWNVDTLVLRGWSIHVSFKQDGSDPKLDRFTFIYSIE